MGDVVNVTKLNVTPSSGLLQDPFTIDVEYSLDRPVTAGFWEIKVYQSVILLVT